MSLFSAVISAAKGATLNSRGGRYAKNGQFDRAIVDFNEVIRIEPKFADGYYNRGNAYAQKGLFHNSMSDFDRAIADFDEAIKLNPKDADYFASRGSWYAKKGQHDRAIADYDEAIRLNPKDAVSIYGRASVYREKGQHDRAKADFEKAMRLNPNFTEAMNRRGGTIERKNELGGRTELLEQKSNSSEPDNFAEHSNQTEACDDEDIGYDGVLTEDELLAGLDFLESPKLITPEDEQHHSMSGSGTYEMPSSLKTTVRVTGLATFFSKAGSDYVVSTIYRKELGGFYQTSILKRSSANSQGGPHRAEPQVVYRIEALSQPQSVQEHIDTVRMVLSKDEGSWLGTKDYQDDVMNALSSANQRNNCPQEMSWTDQRIKDDVLAANINYKRGLFGRLFLT